MTTRRTFLLPLVGALGLAAGALGALSLDDTPPEDGPVAVQLASQGADDPADAVSGNCDEAEHVSDPGCRAALAGPATTGSTPPTTSPPSTSTSTSTTSTAPAAPAAPAVAAAPPATTPASTTATAPASGSGGDISGPCDEAEHANDPRCTGAAAADPTGLGDDRGGGDDDGGGHGRAGDRDEADRGGDDRGGDDRGGDDHGGSSGHGGDD